MLGMCVRRIAGVCSQPTVYLYMCVTRALYLKRKLYFIGHFPPLLQSTHPRLCPSAAEIEFCSFFNSASCPRFNKASRRVRRIWGLLGGGGGGGEGVKRFNSSIAWCWFGISLVPCFTVTHARPLAQS